MPQPWLHTTKNVCQPMGTVDPARVSYPAVSLRAKITLSFTNTSPRNPVSRILALFHLRPATSTKE